MKQVRPLRRLSLLGLSLLVCGCTGGVLPGADGADPSCVLLCALQREISGTPTPPPPVAASAETTKKSPAARSRAAAAKIAPKHVATRARPPSHRAQVSVMPQAPAHEQAPKPAAMVPSAPAPLADVPPPAPPGPAQSLSQAIPGSVGIVAPAWQNR